MITPSGSPEKMRWRKALEVLHSMMHGGFEGGNKLREILGGVAFRVGGEASGWLRSESLCPKASRDGQKCFEGDIWSKERRLMN